MLAWHFVALRKGVPVLHDGRPLPPNGESLEYADEQLDESGYDKWGLKPGLQFAHRIVDALGLGYSGAVACRVDVQEIIEEGSGYAHASQGTCRRRCVLAHGNVCKILVAWARWCADRARTGSGNNANAAAEADAAATRAAAAAAYAAVALDTVVADNTYVAAARAAEAAAAHTAATAENYSVEFDVLNAELERRVCSALGLTPEGKLNAQ